MMQRVFKGKISNTDEMLVKYMDEGVYFNRQIMLYPNINHGIYLFRWRLDHYF